MVPVPTSYLNVPVFGSGASNVQPVGSTYSGGFLPGQLFPAEYENWLMNRLTTNSLASQTTSLSVAAEIVNILNQASIVPDPASTTQLYAALNGLYATVGGLSTEASARASADTTLQSNINAEATARSNADSLLAPKASPALTGTPTAPTPAASDNSTNVSTTQYADRAVSNFGNSFTRAGSFPLSSGAGSFTPAVSGAIRSNYMILIRQGTGSGGGGKMALLLYSNPGTVTLTTVSNQTSITFGVSGTTITLTGGNGAETMDWRAYAIL